MNYEELIKSLGKDFKGRKNEDGFEIHDLDLNLIATIKSKDDYMNYTINKGFNKLGRTKRRMVLYELKRFCQKEKGVYEEVQGL
ncbi:hypothetical protein [uncultured Anaerococcus sp.]|uniref:hypothetical protein n=1 Tax=uncultured Anaerococcus sp. TaxID=293428 RepID=UPI0025D20E7A|nr:hypothetical protein [uncultured Anaerococcus sp.]